MVIKSQHVFTVSLKYATLVKYFGSSLPIFTSNYHWCNAIMQHDLSASLCQDANCFFFMRKTKKPKPKHPTQATGN